MFIKYSYKPRTMFGASNHPAELFGDVDGIFRGKERVIIQFSLQGSPEWKTLIQGRDRLRWQAARICKRAATGGKVTHAVRRFRASAEAFLRRLQTGVAGMVYPPIPVPCGNRMVAAFELTRGQMDVLGTIACVVSSGVLPPHATIMEDGDVAVVFHHPGDHPHMNRSLPSAEPDRDTIVVRSLQDFSIEMSGRSADPGGDYKIALGSR